MRRDDFESLMRGLRQALAHMRGEDVGCVVHDAQGIEARQRQDAKRLDPNDESPVPERNAPMTHSISTGTVKPMEELRREIEEIVWDVTGGDISTGGPQAIADRILNLPAIRERLQPIERMK